MTRLSFYILFGLCARVFVHLDFLSLFKLMIMVNIDEMRLFCSLQSVLSDIAGYLVCMEREFFKVRKFIFGNVYIRCPRNILTKFGS